MLTSPAFLAVRYADPVAASPLLACPDQLLGVVGYGAERPEGLPSSCSFLPVPLLPVPEGAVLEIWTAASPIRRCRLGPVAGACNGELAFGSLILEEREGAALEDIVAQAYQGIFDFLEHTGCDQPIRFWNYLTAITGEEQGLERYRRFNIGRQRIFIERLRQKVPPAASCLGAHHGASVIYFLAAREPAQAIENPRQIAAYAYPPVYGPCSPSFSRASLYAKGGAEMLFISGTASIVGHETRHCGDLQGQIAETIENLRALIANAGTRIARPEDWAFKIYLRDPLYRPAVEAQLTAMFGAQSQRLYLYADICRRDLLIEIEAAAISRV